MNNNGGDKNVQVNIVVYFFVEFPSIIYPSIILVMVRKECKMPSQSKKDYYLICKTQKHETISKLSHL